ncbi:hypothetical protein TNCV_2059851 [Trichonephila clavipes]|nr:hypothetical protein TNCV_2059851 [Trichonephila clavipes]
MDFPTTTTKICVLAYYCNNADVQDNLPTNPDFTCVVMGGADYSTELQNFEVSFVEFVSFPITERLNSWARAPAPGGQWTHKLWGASTNFTRFQVHQPSGFQRVYLCAGSGPISDNYLDKTKSPL